MKRFVLTLTLVLACGTAVFAQTQRTRATAGASQESSISRKGQALDIRSGTRLAAQLQNTLDVSKVRVGDEVVLKTTEVIKSNGRVVVNKGARLIGRITEVQQRSRENAQSSIGLVFDRLENGSLELPITATITSITQANARAMTNDDDLLNANAGAQGSTSARGSQRSSGGEGGLLAGVGNTVGGLLDTTTQTTGSVVGGTTGAVGSTVGNTVNGVGRTVSGIRISQSSSTTAEGGSTLSLTGGNLRLEKNTTFHLLISESANVGGNQ